MSGIYLARNQLKEKTYEESMSEELKLFKAEVERIQEDLKVELDVAASLALQKSVLNAHVMIKALLKSVAQIHTMLGGKR